MFYTIRSIVRWTLALLATFAASWLIVHAYTDIIWPLLGVNQ